MKEAKYVAKQQDYDGETFDVLYRDCSNRKEAFPGLGYYFPPMNQRVYEEDGIICEQDVPVKLRDGTTIYTDIYRPAGQDNLPCLVAWSIYGKRPYDNMSTFHTRGVPDGAISPRTKFEGPDPGYWCRYGYAVANPDPRGVGHSEGWIPNYCTQDGKDGYDFIEWLATRPWCNGRIGLAGNSMLAVYQWFIAAQCPPHLVCMAPWEGCSDIYREFRYEGGIPAVGFGSFIYGFLGGELPERYIEDSPAMGLKYPFINAYWRDKMPRVEDIKIPAYVTAGMNHVHMRGSVNAFNRLGSKEKWLRIHREFEWPDQYSLAMKEDLRAFFDRYLKNIYNGWEMVPRVRLDVMDAYDCDYQIMRPEKAFPLERTVYEKLYLNAETGTLEKSVPANPTSCSYDSETGEVCFDIQFEEDTEITGYMKAHLWIEADGNDDMDLFLTVQKLDSEKNFIPVWVLEQRHPGAWGKIRASRRALDEELTTDYCPVLAHTKDEKLSPGEVVPVEVEIYPYSRIWHKGEVLRLRIAGRYIRDPWFEPFTWELNNKGNHIIHTGGQYDSFLQIPVIPPKYKAGDYIYR